MGDDLAKEVQAILDARCWLGGRRKAGRRLSHYLLWQDRSAKLFEAAALVQQKLAEAVTDNTEKGGK